MTRFPTHTPATAPERSRQILESTQKALGFVPNLYATFAESPAVLQGYTALGAAFGQSSFDAAERQVVLLTTSFENGCEYCMAAHSTIAGMEGVPPDVVGAVRDGVPTGDARLDALARFTRSVVQERGWVGDADLKAFLAAGFTKAQALEVVLGVGLKTISNYVNHIASTPVDDAFQAQTWTRPAAV
jgi:uncharacterized peroxidase-related enzyme